MPKSDHTVLQDIAKTSESLTALHQQALNTRTSRLSLEEIEAEITAVRAKNTADMDHDKP
jgi:hypothetical protein